MPENPLLPHHKLQEMYALMVRCRGLQQKQARKQHKQAGKGPQTRARKQATKGTGTAAREALLAATSLHLLPGDLLCAEPGDGTAQQLAPPRRGSAAPGKDLLPLPSDAAGRLPLCAALARGLQAAAAEGIVLAYATAGEPSTGWPAALEWAQSAQLPLLLVCTDASGEVPARRRSPGSRSKAGAARPDLPLSLGEMNAVAERLRLPVIPVDGEDAVAVYRVMQECTLRARMGGGPAVLWALMAPPGGHGDRPRAQQPVARLKEYMSVRGIPVA